MLASIGRGLFNILMFLVLLSVPLSGFIAMIALCEAKDAFGQHEYQRAFLMLSVFIAWVLYYCFVGSLMCYYAKVSKRWDVQKHKQPMPVSRQTTVYYCIFGHEATKQDVENGGGTCPQCGLNSYPSTLQSNVSEA